MRKFLTLPIVLVLLATAVASPAAQPQTFDLRGPARPEFAHRIAAADLAEFQRRGGRVLDVRLVEDFAADPITIPGAERFDPEQVASWWSKLQGRRPVAVYCVKGKWVSQKVAAYLAGKGIDVVSVEGGLESWKAMHPTR